MKHRNTISLRWLLPSIFIISILFLSLATFLIVFPEEHDRFVSHEEIFELSILSSGVIALIIFILLEIILRRYFLKKLFILQKAAEQVADGQYGIHLQHSRFKEMNSIISSFNRMVYNLEENRRTINAYIELIKQQEKTTQNYLDIVGVMILVLDNDKNVVLINRYGCQIIGYEYEEVIGKNWMENFLPERFRKKVNEVGNSLSTGNPITYFENPVLTKSGEERLIAWRNTYLYDDDGNGIGILTSGQDITDIRAAEIRLRDNAEFYSSIFSAIHEGIIIIQDNIIIDCNDEALRLFDAPRDQLINAPLLTSERIIECHHSSFEIGIQHALSGTPFTHECVLSMQDKSAPKIIEITYSLLNYQKSTFILILRDMTLKNEKERMFRLSARQAQMGEMISMIAHQWRQPLAVINAISSQIRIKKLLSDQEDPELFEELSKIEGQVQHLSQTITDFREFFKPDKKRDTIHLSKLANNAVDLIDHSLKNKGILVEFLIHSDPAISTYRNEILQVLLTLIKNSIDTFVENHIKDAKIVITLGTDETHAFIKIKDNGGGIKPDVMEKLFHPYFTTKSLQDGTGLGLYMSKIVLEEHCEGKILVNSIDDMTEFTLLLPINVKED